MLELSDDDDEPEDESPPPSGDEFSDAPSDGEILYSNEQIN